jgi:hypothetical protein
MADESEPTQFVRVWDTSDVSYDLIDAADKKTLGTFTSLFGGDMQISMISYNAIDANGGVTTMYIPGQISYAPIKLVCSMNSVTKDLTDWFDQSANGDIVNVKRNCTIIHFDGEGNQKMTWDLENVIPTALPGFSWNTVKQAASTSFKMMLQAEKIVINYP